jgi:hypothetical protein
MHKLWREVGRREETWMHVETVREEDEEGHLSLLLDDGLLFLSFSFRSFFCSTSTTSTQNK